MQQHLYIISITPLQISDSHHLHWIERESQDRAGLPDQFIKPQQVVFAQLSIFCVSSYHQIFSSTLASQQLTGRGWTK